MDVVTDHALVSNCSDDAAWIDDELTASNNTASVTIDPTINFLFNGLGILLLAIFGITANLLSVVVLSHPKLKSSLTTLLLGLTISDIFVIGTSLFIFSLSQVLKKCDILPTYATHIRPHLLPWLLPIALTAQMSSLYFTVVITLERYIAVCLPLQARYLCTRSAAQKSALVVVLLSILYNVPRWFEYRTVPESDCNGQITYTETETDFRQRVDYILYYVNWGYLVVIYLVPFTILLYFNIAIYLVAKQHRSRRNSLSPTMASNQSEDIQLAGMLFGIVITFIACNMLALVINVMESFGGIGEIGNLIPINNFLIVLSSSTNFVFYCVFGTEFRRRLKLVLRIKSGRNNKRESSASCMSYVMSTTTVDISNSVSSLGCQRQQQQQPPAPSPIHSNSRDSKTNGNGSGATGGWGSYGSRIKRLFPASWLVSKN